MGHRSWLGSVPPNAEQAPVRLYSIAGTTDLLSVYGPSNDLQLARVLDAPGRCDLDGRGLRHARSGMPTRAGATNGLSRGSAESSPTRPPVASAQRWKGGMHLSFVTRQGGTCRGSATFKMQFLLAMQKKVLHGTMDSNRPGYSCRTWANKQIRQPLFRRNR
jgi:hypothetical protein